MSDRIDLSADTWIDGEHLVTTSAEKAAAWIGLPKGRWMERWSELAGWFLCQSFVDNGGKYRIPRATARERYQYIEGEPCCYLDKQGSIRVAICSFGPASQTGLLALRALLVCGGSPKSFRALHEWIMEAPMNELHLWYHGSTAWSRIEADGRLWGERNAPSQCTYLARDRMVAARYGEVRAVHYIPQGPPQDNYCLGCEQLRVYEPIPISAIRRLP